MEKIANESLENSKYKTDIIPELKSYVINLIQQILPDIEQNNYGLIAIDDVSGRVPGLIITKIVNEILAKKGFQRLLAIGIKPKSLPYLDDKKADPSLIQSKEFLEKYKSKNRKKILVVSEALNTGGNYKILETFFNTLNLSSFDLVTLTSLYPIEKYEVSNGNRIFTSNVKWFESPNPAVDKLPDNTVLVGFIRGDAGKSYLLTGEAQKFIMKQVRADISILAKEIIFELNL